MQFMVDDSGISIIVTTSALQEKGPLPLLSFKGTIFQVDAQWSETVETLLGDRLDVVVSADTPAYILYTSPW